MADVLDALRGDIRGRLNELQPAVEEAKRLEQALQALEASDGQTAQGRQRKTPPKRTRITKAEAESRKRRALALLAEDPQTKPSALAQLLGISASNIYNLIKRLEQDGALKRTEDGYQVQDGTEPS